MIRMLHGAVNLQILPAIEVQSAPEKAKPMEREGSDKDWKRQSGHTLECEEHVQVAVNLKKTPMHPEVEGCLIRTCYMSFSWKKWNKLCPGSGFTSTQSFTPTIQYCTIFNRPKCPQRTLISLRRLCPTLWVKNQQGEMPFYSHVPWSSNTFSRSTPIGKD